MWLHVHFCRFLIDSNNEYMHLSMFYVVMLYHLFIILCLSIADSAIIINLYFPHA